MNKLSEMSAIQVIELATFWSKHCDKKHDPFCSSALVCLEDAKNLYFNGENPEYVKNRALDSLKYSIGILHSEYPR